LKGIDWNGWKGLIIGWSSYPTLKRQITTNPSTASQKNCSLNSQRSLDLKYSMTVNSPERDLKRDFQRDFKKYSDVSLWK